MERLNYYHIYESTMERIEWRHLLHHVRESDSEGQLPRLWVGDVGRESCSYGGTRTLQMGNEIRGNPWKPEEALWA